MKSTRKLLSLLLAIVMTLGTILVPNTAKAEGEKTNTVTLHKLLMTQEELAKWNSDTVKALGYDGTQDLAQLQALVKDQTLKEIAGAYFAWQNADGQWIDQNGTVVDSVDEAYGALTADTGFEFDTSKLPNGSYKIVEVKEKSNYVGGEGELLTDSKAVPVEITLPLVNKDGVVTDAHVYPKNTEEKPKVDKDFAGNAFTGTDNGDRLEADNNIVESKNVGDEVPYEIKTQIPAKTEYKTAVWTDQMTEGLTFNNDVVMTIDGDTAVADTDYTLTKDGNGFVLSLTEEGLKKINGKEDPVDIVITYSATLNEKAVVEVPERNDVQFHYGNEPSHGNTPVPNHPTDDGDMTVTKDFPGVEGGWATGEKVIVTIYDAQTGKPVEFKDEQTATVELSETKQTHTWTGLDKDREYIVKETFIAGDQVTYEKGENGQILIHNKKTNNPNPIDPQEPGVVTGGHRFQKTDEKGEGLAGAIFVVKNAENNYLKLKTGETKQLEQAEYAAAEKAYKDAVKAATAENPDTDNINNLKKVRDAAFAKVNTTWEFTGKNKDDAYEFTSAEGGFFKVTGLAYGDYKLEEKKAPKGYAQIQGDIAFKVAEGSMGETKLDTGILTDEGLKQIENKKITIPQTGGIGSVIFVVAGLMLMGLAGYKIKANKEEIR